MGALVASTTFGIRIDAFHDPRLAATRFLVPAEAAGAWRDDVPAAKQDPPVRRFEIAAGPLAEVIVQFTQLTGLDVGLADPVLGTVQSPGVTVTKGV